jgi:hypothetical protein
MDLLAGSAERISAVSVVGDGFAPDLCVGEPILDR